MLAVTYFLPQPDLRLLYALFAVAAALVIFPVLVAVMPSVIGCCAVVLPVVGKMLVGGLIIASYAVVMKPK